MAGGFINGYVVMLSLAVVVMMFILGKGSSKFSAVPSVHYDLGEQVDRIVVDDLTGDVYVAGDNVLYHLNSGLTLLQNITLDSTKSCRCNNSVKVLEIDPTFRRLLVCASSEKGECVFKELKNIRPTQPFIKEQIQESGFVGYRIVVDDSEVPFVHFDQQSSSANSNTSRLVVVSPNTIKANDQHIRSKPLLSVREIYNKAGMFYMRYVTTKEGQLQMNKFNTRFQYYVIDKFCYSDTCYFITLQQENQRSDVLVNRLGVVCSRSLYPYVELPLVFTKNNNGVEDRSRVLAAAVGKVGDETLGEIPLVVIVFGVASNGSARHADVTLGYSITVISLEELETFAFVAILQCDLEILASPDWIDGTPSNCVRPSHQNQQAKCNRTEKMTVRQVQDEPLTVTAFIPGGKDTGNVVSVFTHTLVDDNVTQRLDETMIIYVLLSSGQVHIFRCSRTHGVLKTIYLGPALMYSKTPADSGTWQVKADIAITGEFFYYLSATKVLKVPLDYCLNISTCEDCLETKGCYWCQSHETCGLRSKNCFAETCPARIENFWPTSGPTKGGTQLSLYFTESLSNNTTIEVCGQPCSEIRKQSERSVTCTVPASKIDSEAVCNIVVTLWSNPTTRISATGYRYKIPEFEGFEPSRMIISERGQMRLHGQHLDTGSTIAVILSSDKDTVNGDKLTCDVLDKNRTSLLCQLNTTRANSGNNRRLYCYGITLTIDNARLELRSGVSFCRHPDPTLTQVYPLFTFASGGTQVTLKGTDLNTTGFPYLALSLPANETGEYKEEISQHPCQPCTGSWNKTCLLCCLPVFSSLTSTNESLQVWYSFREERVNQTLAPVVLNGSSPLTLSVLPDPQFVLADLHSHKCLPMGEQVTPLTVMSRGMTVNTTLSIRVGGRRCAITEKSSSTWTCDFPSLAPVLKKSGVTCEDSSSQGSVPTADQSVCGENICGQTNLDPDIFPVQVVTEYRRFHVACVNLTQTGNRKDDHLSLLLTVGGGALGGVVLLIIMVMCCVMYVKYQKRKFEEKFRTQHSITSSNYISSPVGSAENTYLSLVHLLNPQQDKKKEKDIYHSKLLIQRKNLTLGNVIGNGNFGCVLEGELRGKDGEEPLRVAVKTLLDPVTHAIDLQGFIDEALLMKNFNHEHVLGLLGLSEGDRGLPLVVLPFMERGDLLTYVKNENTTLSVGDVMQFACDIASGMDYLSGLKFVHRDLAARNCMLDSELRVKVADFGLCRDIYEKGYYHSDNKKKLPIRWMAIESIEKGTYTSKSDVWSMGVVLWELTTRGITPYPGVEGWDLLRYLMAGRRLEQPLLCPDVLYALMERCWQEKPIDRPSFKDMENELQGLAKTLEQPVFPDAIYLATLIAFPECRRYRMDLFFEASLQPARRQSVSAVPVFNEPDNKDRPSLEKMDDIVKDMAKARPRPAPKLAPKPAPRSKGTKQQSEAGVNDSKPDTEEAAHSEPAIELKDVSKKGRKTVRRSDGSYYVLET